MIRFLVFLKCFFLILTGFLGVYVFNFFTDLLLFPGHFTAAEKPLMFACLSIVVLSIAGLLVVFNLERKLRQKISEDKNRLLACVYCQRPFEEGEEVWFNEELGFICRPDPAKECNATHIGNYRTNDWRAVIFRSERES